MRQVHDEWETPGNFALRVVRRRSRHAAIVDGGGLAGVSAAKAMLENSDKTVLLDKISFCGGDAHSEADTRIEGWPQKKFQGLTPKSMQRT